MPPQPKHHLYAAEKRRAAGIFVDRDEPRALYRAAVEQLAREPGRPHLLVYHGVGGQGKTALCRKLIAESKGRDFKPFNIGCGLIDLHENPPAGPIHAIVALRNALAAATGKSFPAFDLAYADYWARSNPEKPAFVLGGTTVKTLADLGSESSGDLAESGLEVATDLAAGVPFLGPTLKRLTRWTIAKTATALVKAHAPALQLLYQDDYTPQPQTIIDCLPDILAHELALHQKAGRARRPVIFIDEYENALPHGGGQGPIHSTAWDGALRDFISACANGAHRPPHQPDGYAYQVGALFVILGREKLRWPEIDPAWTADLEGRQHLLGGLAPADAEDFLQKAGIADPALRAAIQAASSIPGPADEPVAFPILLDLSVQIYFDTKAAGREPTVADFTLEASGYEARRVELFQRFMRSYHGLAGLEPLLRRLSCIRYFDADLIRKFAADFQLGFDTLEIPAVLGLSFINEAPGLNSYVMSAFIADVLAGTVDEAERKATLRSAIQAYESRFEDTPHSMNRFESVFAYGQAEICRAKADEPPGGMPWNLALKLVGILLDPLAEAVAIRRRRHPEDLTVIKVSLNSLGIVHAQLRDFEAAKAAFEQVFDLQNRVDPDDLYGRALCLNNLGNVYTGLGDYAAAKSAHKESVAICRRLHPGGHRELALSLYNLGFVQVHLSDYDAAKKTYEEALAIRRRILQADHPQIAATLNNLGRVYRALGDLDADKAVQEEALAMRRRALPEDHPHIAISYFAIGNLNRELGDLEATRVAYEEGLGILRRTLPADHADINIAEEVLREIAAEIDSRPKS